MPKAWSDKRERQYEHIKDSLEERGKPEKLAEEKQPAPSTRSAPAPAKRKRPAPRR